MKNELARCYKFYDAKGKRVAAFCRELKDGTHEVFLLKCSKEDQFSKETANEVYEKYITDNLEENTYHPEILYLKPINNDGTLKTLLKFMALNFYVGVEEKELKSVLNLYHPLKKSVYKSFNKY